MLDIGGKGRKRVDCVADLAGGDSEPHGKGEDVDQFFSGMAHDMRAEDAIGGFIDNHLGPGGGLVVGSGSRANRSCRWTRTLILRPSSLAFASVRSDAGESRNGVDAGRNAGVVGLGDRTFHDVAADDAAFIGGDRRQLRRAPKHVAADVNGRIRGGAQILVGIDTSAAVPDASGLEIQRVDIGDPPGAIDDPIGFELMLGAVMLERHAKAARRERTMCLTIAPVLTSMPIRSLSVRTCCTASASIPEAIAARPREW